MIFCLFFMVVLSDLRGLSASFSFFEFRFFDVYAVSGAAGGRGGDDLKLYAMVLPGSEQISLMKKFLFGNRDRQGLF